MVTGGEPVSTEQLKASLSPLLESRESMQGAIDQLESDLDSIEKTVSEMGAEMLWSGGIITGGGATLSKSSDGYTLIVYIFKEGGTVADFYVSAIGVPGISTGARFNSGEVYGNVNGKNLRCYGDRGATLTYVYGIK